MAAPVAILASRLPVKWLAPAFAAQLALGLALATVNYQHWDGYRTFAAALRGPSAGHRVWVDNDWGLRYYLENDHGLPARKGQQVRPGDIIVSSELGHNVEFTAPLSRLADADIDSTIPLRLIGLNSHSGYSTVAEGYLPFGFSTDPIDRIHARMVMERHPTLEYVTTNSPDAAGQIVSGIFPNDRWMSGAGDRRPEESRCPQKAQRRVLYSAQRPGAPGDAAARRPRGRARTLPGTGRIQAHFRRTAAGLYGGGPRGPDFHRPRRSARARHGAARRRLLNTNTLFLCDFAPSRETCFF